MSECFDLSRNSTLFFPLCLILLPSVISTSGQDLQCVTVRVTDKANKSMPDEFSLQMWEAYP